jgi:hypothetical protein
MTLSMYQAAAPNFIHGLSNLTAILKKAEANAAERKIDPSVFVQARLAPDMFPLARQIQIVSDIAKGGVARLSGTEVPSFPDTETSFPELQARIAKTVDFIQSVDPAKMDGSEDKNINFKAGGMELSFSGQAYLFQYVIPNFYFHTTVAYSILRHNGVPIGKMDFLGQI